jgi:hypothetical protein
VQKVEEQQEIETWQLTIFTCSNARAAFAESAILVLVENDCILIEILLKLEDELSISCGN